MDKLLTCNRCGWVSYPVSREHAEGEVVRFNQFFETLSQKEKDDLYGGKGASIDFYEHCFRCGGPYQDFREAAEGDCPDGVTINPIIDYRGERDGEGR